jgi:hypothetical protein
MTFSVELFALTQVFSECIEHYLIRNIPLFLGFWSGHFIYKLIVFLYTSSKQFENKTLQKS